MAAQQFYFAWIDEDEVFGPTHHRNDEHVFAFEIEQIEGEFCSMVLDLANPQQGLLNPGRKQWCYLAYEKIDGTVVPLFKGRVIGMPEDMAKYFIRVSFLARPSDYETRLTTLADSLKVLPYWDPIWLNATNRDNPFTVLEGRTALFNIDRVTHEVTISDIVIGEDGTIDFGTNCFFDGTATQHTGPTARVDVEATVQWDQRAAGAVDITQTVRSAFGGGVASFTGDGLRKDWPKKGDNIGSGWRFGESFCNRTSSTASGLFNVRTTKMDLKFPVWTFDVGVTCEYAVERSRTERIKFSAISDIQPLVTDYDEPQNEVINLSSSDIDEPIDPGGLMPIDPTSNSFFTTDRGKLSFQYLLNKARARLLASARAVEVSCEVPFETAIDLTTRMNAAFTDARLPGGGCIGKVIGYTYSLSGDTGALTATTTVGCLIGNGGVADAPVTGTPTYVDDYVDGYQVYEGSIALIDQGDIAFEVYDNQPIHDDGVRLSDLNEQNSVLNCVVFGKFNEQAAVLSREFVDPQEAFAAVNDVYTEVALTMKPLKSGPFDTTFNVVTTPLRVPKTIDLEAP